MKDYSHLTLFARDWKPNTEYIEGEYVWIMKSICEIVQEGTTGDRFSSWPGSDRGSIVFSGFGDTAVRAIIRQTFSEDLLDRYSDGW